MLKGSLKGLSSPNICRKRSNGEVKWKPARVREEKEEDREREGRKRERGKGGGVEERDKYIFQLKKSMLSRRLKNNKIICDRLQENRAQRGPDEK